MSILYTSFKHPKLQSIKIPVTLMQTVYSNISRYVLSDYVDPEINHSNDR